MDLQTARRYLKRHPWLAAAGVLVLILLMLAVLAPDAFPFRYCHGGMVGGEHCHYDFNGIRHVH